MNFGSLLWVCTVLAGLQVAAMAAAETPEAARPDQSTPGDGKSTTKEKSSAAAKRPGATESAKEAAPSLTAGQQAQLAEADKLERQTLELLKSGKAREATEPARQALALYRQVWGEGSPKIVPALRGLATVYRLQGAPHEAVPLLQSVLKITKEAHGLEHPEMAKSFRDLAEIFSSQAQYEKAISLFRAALSIHEKTLGPNDPSVAQDLAGVGLIYHHQGKDKEALSAYKRALRITQVRFGAEDPRTAALLLDVAAIHTTQGDFAEALPLYERALKIREKVLGLDHPAVASTLRGLADWYCVQGQYAEALPLFERSLKICETALGPDHVDTAASVGSLARLYKDRGDYALALKLCNRAVSILAKKLGRKHPESAQMLARLAELHRLQGNYSEAIPLYQFTLKICQQSHGPDSSAVADQLTGLAQCYGAQKDYAKALPLYERVLSIAEKNAGPDHPATAAALEQPGADLRAARPVRQSHPDVPTSPAHHRGEPRRQPFQHREHAEQSGRGLPERGQIYPGLGIAPAGRGDLAKGLGPGSSLHAQRLAQPDDCPEEQRRLGPGAAEPGSEPARGAATRMRVLPVLSAKQQLLFLEVQDRAPFQDSLLLGWMRRDDPQAVALSAAWLANGKAIAHETLAQQSVEMHRTTNPKRAESLKNLLDVRRKLASAALESPEADQEPDRSKQLAELERQEELLSRVVAGGGKRWEAASPWIELADLRKKIPVQGALVDIARLDRSDLAKPKRGSKSSARYIAWLTPAAGEGELQIVDLGDADEVDAAVTAAHRAFSGQEIATASGVWRWTTMTPRPKKTGAIRPPSWPDWCCTRFSRKLATPGNW